MSEISTAKPFLHFPLLPAHPRLRFIDGAPDAPADPPAEPAEDPADPEDPPTDPEPPATDDEELGDAGKKALDAWKARAKAAEAARKAVESELAKSKADDRARDEAREAATKVANERAQRAELKAAAKGRLVDPSEALLNIDPTQFAVDENGDIDSDALNQAITALLEKKPYLAAPSNPFKGGGDGGATPPPKPADSVDQLAAQALASGDTRGSIALKLSTLNPPTS